MHKTINASFVKKNSSGEIEQVRRDNIIIDCNRSTTMQILEYSWNQLPYGWRVYNLTVESYK